MNLYAIFNKLKIEKSKKLKIIVLIVFQYSLYVINVVPVNLIICRVADDFDDVDDEDNIELEPQEDDGENIELLNANEATAGVQKSKRITTRYMTKYVYYL